MSGMILRSRAFSTEALKVVNNVARKQYTVALKNAEANLTYDENGKTITFIYTDVPPQFQGKGVGKLLAKYAFDYAKENKLDVICKCHFLAKYYEDNKTIYSNINVKLDLE